MIYLWFTNTLYYDCNIQLTWSFFFSLSLLFVFSRVCVFVQLFVGDKAATFSVGPFFLLHKSRLNFYLMREQDDEKKRRRENHHHTIQAFSNGMILSIGSRKCMLMIDTNYTQMIHQKSNKKRSANATPEKKMNSIQKKSILPFLFLTDSLLLSFFWFVKRINEKQNDKCEIDSKEKDLKMIQTIIITGATTTTTTAKTLYHLCFGTHTQNFKCFMIYVAKERTKERKWRKKIRKCWYIFHGHIEHVAVLLSYSQRSL